MIRRLLLGAALLIGCAALPEDAQATSLSELSTDQMVDASDLVVRGTVTEVWTELDDRGTVWTQVQVEVGEVLKGDPSTTHLVVSQIGGVHMETYQLVPMAPRFSVGEEAYLFLEQLPNGRLSVVGMFQGKYTVRICPDTGKEHLVRVVLSQDAWYDHRFIPHPPLEERIWADDLEADVQHRVEVGWDGQPIPGTSLERLQRVNSSEVTR